MSNERRLDVYDRKYTFVLKHEDWRVHVLRHGEPWIVIENGCNAVRTLVFEAVDDRALVGAVRRWATSGDGYQDHRELHQAFRAYCDERGERKPPALEEPTGDTAVPPRENLPSVQVALSSAQQFLESLLAEGVDGHRLRLEASLEGVQRALAYLGSESDLKEQQSALAEEVYRLQREVTRLRSRWQHAEPFVHTVIDVYNETEVAEGAQVIDKFDRALVRAMLKPAMDGLIALHGTLSDEEIRENLREAGYDPNALVERMRPKIEALLAKRRDLTQTPAALLRETAVDVDAIEHPNAGPAADVLRLIAEHVDEVPLSSGGWIIVRTSNLGNSGEAPGRDERIIADEIPDRVAADNMCEAINDRCSGDDAPWFYKVQAAGYVPKVFRP